MKWLWFFIIMIFNDDMTNTNVNPNNTKTHVLFRHRNEKEHTKHTRETEMNAFFGHSQKVDPY
jgi:hypothetical protein